MKPGWHGLFTLFVFGNLLVSGIFRVLNRYVLGGEAIFYRNVTAFLIAGIFLLSLYFLYKKGSSLESSARFALLAFCLILLLFWGVGLYYAGMASPFSFLVSGLFRI